MERCQFGCGESFRSHQELWVHKSECEHADKFRRMTGPKIHMRAWEYDDSGVRSSGSRAQGARC
eukprot:1702262-Rhodomonas_salina.1